MARVHRRIKTGRLVARALDDTFTGTTHVIALIAPRWHRRPGTEAFDVTYRGPGSAYSITYASLDGPNGFPGNTGGVAW